jgi:hypothetical protein
LHVIDLMEKEVVGVVMKEFNTVLKRKWIKHLSNQMASYDSYAFRIMMRIWKLKQKEHDVWFKRKLICDFNCLFIIFWLIKMNPMFLYKSDEM